MEYEPALVTLYICFNTVIEIELIRVHKREPGFFQFCSERPVPSPLTVKVRVLFSLISIVKNRSIRKEDCCNQPINKKIT